MLRVKRIFGVTVSLVLALGWLPVPVALAMGGCNVTISPHSLSPGTQSDLQFDIQNTGSDPIAWVQIQRPTDSYTVTSVSQTGWTDTTDENGTTLEGGTLDPAGSYGVRVTVQTAAQDEDAAAWTIRAALGADGSDMMACDGSLETAIATPPPPPTPNGISSVGLTAISPTAATISWTSAAPATSVVAYGLTDQYGKTATAPGTAATHRVTLSGLSPSTSYHYMVSGVDGTGHNFFSADNTFITPAQPAAPVKPAATPAAAAAYPAVAGDTTPPTVQLTTAFSKPFTTPPLIKGTAADNGILARLQYSTDGGRNWSAVPGVTGLGGKQASFSFTPPVPGDGNYGIVVEATDSNGNIGKSQPATLIIDRLPPQVGPAVLSYGPEAVPPDANGALQLLAGANYHVQTSAIGGATIVTLEALLQPPASHTPISFSLTQSTDNGLWNGLISFKTAGLYQLTARSLDGAGNVTTQPFMTAMVAPAGQVVEADAGQPLPGAQLTLHYFEPSMQSWQIWDGAAYNQANPQTAHADGSYSFTVPAGKYYLSVKAAKHQKFISDSFTTNAPLALASSIKLHALAHWSLGPLTFYRPDLGLSSQPLPATPQLAAAKGGLSLVGAQLPAFDLPMVAGGHKRSVELEGRPTDLVILATWSTGSQNQLAALAQAGTHHDVNIMPVFSQEDASKISVYLATAGYSFNALVDPEGTLAAKIPAVSPPEHIFIDRNGRIKKVMVGVLSKDEVLDMLGGL